MTHKDRHVFAFRDGLYITSCDALTDRHRYGGGGSSESHPPSRVELGDAFVPYGVLRQEALVPDDVAPCKFFDDNFVDVCSTGGGVDLAMRPHHVRRTMSDHCTVPCVAASEHEKAELLAAARAAACAADSSWTRIPTPHLQSIFDHQQFPREVCEWAYALMGRLLYEVNEADGWQVIPFLKGRARTGKSTLLNDVCRNFFDAAEVGVLSNNIERGFGLGALVDKFLFIGNDIKSDLQLDREAFQSIASGGSLQVTPLKHHAARAVRWRTTGILAGEETPSWVDGDGDGAANDIVRHFVVFEFGNAVGSDDQDPYLFKKLHAELPRILVKCNRAYQALVRRVGARTVWSCLPDYFRHTMV